MAVVIVYADDWEGLYIDGVLKFENHNIDVRDFCKYVGLQVEFRQANEDWLGEVGRLPADLQNVVCYDQDN